MACEWELLAEDGRTLSQHRLDYGGEDPFVWCLSHILQTLSPVHWRSNLIAAGGFDESLPRCQEFDLHLRLFRSGIQLKTVFEPLFQVRRQSASVSSNFRSVYSTRREIKLRLSERIAMEEGSPIWVDAVAQSLAVDGRQLVRKGFCEDGRDCFRSAKKISIGSINRAFPNKISQRLLPFLGPVLTERLAQKVACLLGTVTKSG